MFVHTPHKLLDTLLGLLNLKNDAELARTLGVASPCRLEDQKPQARGRIDHDHTGT
jgi:hypothetical protein